MRSTAFLSLYRIQWVLLKRTKTGSVLASEDCSIFVACALCQSKKKASRKTCASSYCSQGLNRFGWHVTGIVLVDQNSAQTAQRDDYGPHVTRSEYVTAPVTGLVYTFAPSDLQGINGWDTREQLCFLFNVGVAEVHQAAYVCL
jgi:hypothetical protein